MFYFVRLLKFLPAAYFINDFLSRVDMMTRIRLRHDIDRNKRHYQIVILVNNLGYCESACLTLVRQINDEFKNWRNLNRTIGKRSISWF